MTDLFKIILGSSIVTSFLTSIIAYIFHKKTERTNAEIKREFEILSHDFEWKQKTTELLGQVYIHLNRTSRAFQNKYSKLENYNAFYEDEIIFTSNKRIRDILLENGHYLPPELLDEASKLIEHYDVWLVKYNNLRKVNNDKSTIQIYVGPDGFNFPENAEEIFKEKYTKMFQSIRQL